MATPTTAFFHSSASTIPTWTTSIDAVLQRKPAPSLRGPGIPAAWMETWEALEAVLLSHASAAGQVAQEMQHSPTPWSKDLVTKIRRISSEPAVPLDAVHLVSTGRGLIMLVAPQGFCPEQFQDGMMMVAPWSCENLTGWTHFRGDSEQLDQSFARPWVLAAWRIRKLLVLKDRPPTGPVELTIPNYMALQAARILK
ncbi:MAG TPA: hypothetical protein HPP80_09365 [Rhodospirillaceae bacterium]|nr:hypothetical protein [Rhodospirillaceae bacterium]